MPLPRHLAARRTRALAPAEPLVVPDVEEDARKWNDYWEGTASSPPLYSTASSQSNPDLAFGTTDYAVWEVGDFKRRIVKDIATFSSQLFDGAFLLLLEQLWRRSLNNDAREQMILTAFRAAESMMLNSGFRALTLDFTLRRLAHGSGFLDLLDHFMASGRRYASGEDFIELVSPWFDRKMSIERDALERLPRAVRLNQYLLILHRHNYLFSFTASVVLLLSKASKLGHFSPKFASPILEKASVPGWTKQLTPPRNPYAHSANAADVQEHRRLVRKVARQEQRERPTGDRHAALMQKREESCFGCYRQIAQMPEAVEGKVSFFYCPKCLKVGRKMSYCSRDCQLAHYNAGHKADCGKSCADLFPTPTLQDSLSIPSPPPCGVVWQLHNLRRPPPYKVDGVYAVSFNRPRKDGDTRPMHQILKPGTGDDAQDRKIQDDARALLTYLASSKEAADDLDTITMLAGLCLSPMLMRAEELSDADVVHQIAKDFRVSHKALWANLERRSGGRWKAPEVLDDWILAPLSSTSS